MSVGKTLLVLVRQVFGVENSDVGAKVCYCVKIVCTATQTTFARNQCNSRCYRAQSVFSAILSHAKQINGKCGQVHAICGAIKWLA